MISNYKNHPSINQIRKKSSNPKKYSFPEAKKRRNKYTNQDGIPKRQQEQMENPLKL